MSIETVKAFLMTQVRMQQVEKHLQSKQFQLNHSTICQLAIMQKPNTLALKLAEIVGDSFKEFKGICGAILRASKKTGESCLTCISALSQSNPARYEVYLKATLAINTSNQFKQEGTHLKFIQNKNLWTSRNEPKIKEQTSVQTEKQSGDPYQDKIEAHAEKYGLTFEKAMASMALENGSEHRAYTRRVKMSLEANHSLLEATQIVKDKVDVEKQISYQMQINNIDQMAALTLIKKEDPALYSEHLVNVQNKFDNEVK